MTKKISFTIGLVTFFLLMLGGIVHNTQSSLACPDWPTCYGTFFPKMEGNVMIEHGHRLLATLVGFLTILLVLFSWLEKKETILKYSSIALALVITQGVLGGITVIYKLPTIVSTSHLSLSMIFFCTMIYIHHRLTVNAPVMNSSYVQNRWPLVHSINIPKLRLTILISTVLIYSQIVLGAFMRHSGAGMACGQSWDNAILCLDTVSWAHSWWPTLLPAQLHMTHRFYAIGVTIITIFYVIKLLFALKSHTVFNLTLEKSISSKLRFLSYLYFAVILFQVFLGMMTVATGLEVTPTTLHLCGAALCLAILWKMNLLLKSVEQEVFPEGPHTYLGDILALAKPKLALLVMSTVFIGMLLAPGHINFFKGLLAIFLIGLVVFSAGAMNSYLEKDIDAKMLRTKDRPLPAARIMPEVALFLGVVPGLLAIVILAIFINGITAFLSALAYLLYIYAYTPMKKVSVTAVYIGSIPGAIPPLLGWASVDPQIGILGWALFVIMIVWQLPHFFSISLYHSNDYKEADIKVYPNMLGEKGTCYLIAVFTLLLYLTTLLPYYFANASSVYLYFSLVLGGAFVLLSLRGVFLWQNKDQIKKWSRQYFWASIIYLPTLLCAMLFFK